MLIIEIIYLFCPCWPILLYSRLFLGWKLSPNEMCSEMSGFRVKITSPYMEDMSYYSLAIGPFQHTQTGPSVPKASQTEEQNPKSENSLASPTLLYFKSFLSLNPLGSWNIWLCTLTFFSFWTCLDLVSCLQLFSFVLTTIPLETYSENFLWPWKPQ